MILVLTDSANRQYIVNTDFIEYVFHSIPNPLCTNFYITIGFHKIEKTIEFDSIQEMKKIFDLILHYI